jgi:hypothetical protein
MAGGDCAECNKNRLKLHTKLKVSEPGDLYEQEADRIADLVMAAPPYQVTSRIPPRIQRLTGQSTGQLDSAPASVDQVLASPGKPLEPELRQDMEQRFGHDFSSVRVHSGGAAEQSAQDVNASAYTMGHDIVFGAGRFAPGTHEGQCLIAHELTHVVQQSASAGTALQRQSRGAAAGCGICMNDPGGRVAGGIAHTEVQDAFIAANPDMVAERPVPGIPNSGIDISYERRRSGEHALLIGEIKPLDDAGQQAGVGRRQLQDYAREMMLSGQYDEVYRMPNAPPAGPLYFFNPTNPGGCPRQIIMVQLTERGLYQYYCEPPFSQLVRLPACRCAPRRQEPEQEQDLNVPLLVTVAALLGLSTAVAAWPRAKAPTVPTTTPRTSTVSAPQPAPQPHAPSPKATPSSTATRRPHRPPPRPAAGKSTRVHRPAAGTRVSPPRATPRVGPRPGGIRASSGGGALRVGGGLLMLLSLYGGYKAIQGAKADIDAMRGPLEALWDEFEKQRASGKRGDDPAAATAQPTPAPTPLRPEPEPPHKPPEKETKVALFEITRSRLSERETSVPSASIGTSHIAVEFFSLTQPGERTTAVGGGQIDCSRIHKGIAGVSGYQKYKGYARVRDVNALYELLGNQIALAQLACVMTGRGPQPAAQPDGDEISVTLSTSGESVTATCNKLAGASGSTCTSEGNFSSMKALMDDPELEAPPDFVLEVAVVRTRNGESQRSDRTISVWVENPDHPMPEPRVQADGSVPGDASDWKAYPSGSEIAYLLELYSRWGQ